MVWPDLISPVLRERLVLAVEYDGISARAAAARFDVSVSSAIKWVRRHHETGSVSPGKMGVHKPNILSDAHADWLIARVQTGLAPAESRAGCSFGGILLELHRTDAVERVMPSDGIVRSRRYIGQWRLGHRRESGKRCARSVQFSSVLKNVSTMALLKHLPFPDIEMVTPAARNSAW